MGKVDKQVTEIRKQLLEDMKRRRDVLNKAVTKLKADIEEVK